MNFLHILGRFVFIFFALSYSIFPIPDLSASYFQEFGHPHIQTCLPGTYTWIDHYNSIVQNEEGYIFIGARNGILKFEDSSWKYVPAKGNIQLVPYPGNLIAYSKNLLGTLILSDSGELTLSEGLPEQGETGIPEGADTIKTVTSLLKGTLIQVHSLSGNLYILTSGGLYLKREGAPEEIETDLRILRICPYGEGILLQTDGGSLYRYAGDRFRKIELPSETGILKRMVPFNNRSILVEGTEKDFILEGERDSVFEFSLPAGLAGSVEISCAAMLGTGERVLGTANSGILLVSPDGKFLTRITTSEGLYGNDIVQLLADRAGSLWALHDHAVSRIEIPSAFSTFNPENGLYGDIKDILRHKGELYAASNRGLFKLKAREEGPYAFSGNAEFVQVQSIEGECRCLASAGDKLIAGGAGGLYEISGETVHQLLTDPVNVLHYESVKKILLVGSENGLRILNMADRKEIRNFSLPNVSIDDIVHLASGILWLSSRSGVIYRSSGPLSDAGNLQYESYTTEDLDSINGSFIDLIDLSGTLYFSSYRGLFRFDPSSRIFFPDTSFLFPLEKGSFLVKQMARDTEEMIWISIEGPGMQLPKIWMGRTHENGGFQMHPLPNRRLNTLIINRLYPDNGKILWIGTQEGLVRYDPGFSRPVPPPSQTHITRITLRKDPIVPATLPDRVKIPFAGNRIRFAYSSADYNCESSFLFQYRLLGISDNWSEWSDIPYVEFGGLKSGRYEFQVRNQDIYGMVSSPDTFQFSVKSPVYASWYAIVLYVLLILVILFLFQKWRHLLHMRAQYHLEEVVQERTESLIKEKEQSEDLLANILPKTTSDELKAKGKATSSKFKMVTVLFADIQGFTMIAEHMNPDKLIDQLDRFYFHFDSVVEKYNIEKIKTIGDAYMAAGGIPIKNRTNPVDVILAALEMQQHMKDLKKSHSDIWDLRIGIHTGSVIAGVVGQKKYSYDIWGDTVNTASRMESSGVAGRVNISATTYKLIKDFFQCEFRGKMPVKYKGDIAMFFVNGLNPVYSEADRITPNARFHIQVQLLRLLDLEEFILDKLEKELPGNLFFHNVEHTTHVYTQVELLGRGEKVGDEDLLLLKTAALFHDIGYIERVDDHETRSMEFAREILPLYRYKDEQIERICELIMASRMPPKPANLLEQIICDANLDHLGRVDFLIQSDLLFQELRIMNRVKSKKEWNQLQIEFLETHDFYTSIARRMREVPKEQQIENIKQFS